MRRVVAFGAQQLLKLQDMGKVKQWPRNPQFFFVVGLERVALVSAGDRVGVSTRYPAKTQADWAYCKELLSM